MKKSTSLLFCLTLLLTSCNGPLRRKMLKYYEDDENYVELTGIVKSIVDYQYEMIELWLELQDKNDYFIHDYNDEGHCLFAVYSLNDPNIDLKEEDEIRFTTSMFYFYNGHRLPIVAIERNEEILLEFEVGKNNYIEWIKETFK